MVTVVENDTKIRKVLIVAGTHGNELPGIYLVKYWQKNCNLIARTSFSSSMLLANSAAVQRRVRYIDADLNRQFSIDDLKNNGLNNIEQLRAKNISVSLGGKENPTEDFIIDLHTTTASMGLSIIVKSESFFVKQMAFYLATNMLGSTIFYEPVDRLEDNFLISLGRLHGLVIEVGPTPQGVLRADTVALTEQAALHTLDYIDQWNSGKEFNIPEKLTAYQFIHKVQFPQSKSGEIIAMIHPDRQDKDYQLISQGDPLFLGFDGREYTYEGEETVVAAFINEAAYYDQNIGLSLLKKIKLTLSPRA